MIEGIKCPHCGGTKLQYHYTTVTAMDWAQIYENGELISKNPNWYTEYYTCCNCRTNFHVKSQYGEIVEVIDDGIPELLTVNVDDIIRDNITVTGVVNYNDYCIKTEPTESTIELPYVKLQTDVEDLKRQITYLGEKVDKLVYLQEKMQTQLGSSLSRQT